MDARNPMIGSLPVDPREWVEDNADELSAAMHSIRQRIQRGTLNPVMAYEVAAAMRIIVKVGSDVRK